MTIFFYKVEDGLTFYFVRLVIGTGSCPSVTQMTLRITANSFWILPNFHFWQLASKCRPRPDAHYSQSRQIVNFWKQTFDIRQTTLLTPIFYQYDLSTKSTLLFSYHWSNKLAKCSLVFFSAWASDLWCSSTAGLIKLNTFLKASGVEDTGGGVIDVGGGQYPKLWLYSEVGLVLATLRLDEAPETTFCVREVVEIKFSMSGAGSFALDSHNFSKSIHGRSKIFFAALVVEDCLDDEVVDDDAVLEAPAELASEVKSKWLLADLIAAS